MKLDESAESLALDIAFWMEGIVDPSYEWSQLGRLALDLSTKLRALGIILLLTKGDTDSFHFNLIRSGRVWRHYLRRIESEKGQEDHHFCTGRFEPLLDCIASGQFEIARDIASLSPKEWRKGHEYEDDYCFGRLLQILVMPEFDQTIAAEVIDQFQAYLAEGDSSRLAVMESLIARDQSVFNDAFQALIDSYQIEIKRNKDRGQLEEPHVVAQRRVFVEGLALLRLAEKQGLVTESEYDLCPSVARMPVGRSLPEDSDPDMAGWLR